MGKYKIGGGDDVMYSVWDLNRGLTMPHQPIGQELQEPPPPTNISFFLSRIKLGMRQTP